MPVDLESHLALKKLRGFDSAAVEDAQSFRDEVTLFIRRESLRRAAEFLRDDPELTFTFLADVTAVDHYPTEPRFETVYHLLSMKTTQRLRLKVRLAGDDPRVESMVPVWPSAEAYEREVFDLMGIQFRNHPFLRRILMPDEWEGHPLRKDYPVQGNITRWP
jgi:NADH-quinone oxidoreductase subunit C